MNLATFTPNARIQALTREQVLAITDLFGMNKRGSKNYLSPSSVNNIVMKTKYSDLSNQLVNSGNYEDKVWGEASKEGGIKIDYSIKPTLKDRVRARAVVGHESAHMLGGEQKGLVGNNEIIAASAIGRYFLSLGRISDSTINKPLVSNSTRRGIEKVCQEGEYEKAVKMHKNLRAAEYEPFIEGKSLSYFGRALGVLALTVEEELKMPGIGLFVIREVSKGRGIQDTISNAKNGKFSRELITWFGRHPSLRSHILRTAYPKLFTQFAKYVRPKITRKVNPAKPRKKKMIIKICKG